MTTREQSMQFWNSLGDSFFEKIQLKQELTDKYFPKRNFGTLTGSEIEEIFRKENKTTEENIYLNRLKEQYKKYKQEEFESTYFKTLANRCKHQYDAVRLFCLDTELLDFDTIVLMEYEVNRSF